ncbi:hypothetical protein FOT91_17420 [Klebsiella michiganensis]|nr:hypothetical protein [Klebsiella michiganensis]MBE0157002.1 hypothetical protein [Klebsiella michiganensis]MBE0169679.1 hypothetical protein [Klebsiella michiganensis]MBE0190509.1 hypothetical protein [Klebsiella michiganensis]MBE0203298.1 hypothetical protein [Klebsiella michiganensis]
MASWRFVPWLILNPVILQVACALAVLLGSSMSLAPIGPAQALFKTVNRFVLQLELFRENKRDIRWMVPFFSSKWSME